MHANKKTLSSVLVTLCIVAMLVFIQPMVGLQVSIEDLPDKCNKNEEISFKANITIDTQEWSNISSIKLIISKDGRNDTVDIPINLTHGAVVKSNMDLTNTSSELIEVKVDSETNAVYGYGYGYGYINGSIYADLTYQYGYGYGYGYTGYGYNVLNAPSPAFIVYNIKWKPESSGTYTIKLIVTVQRPNGGSVEFSKEKTVEVSEPKEEPSPSRRPAVSEEEETETPGTVAKEEVKTTFEPGKPTEISLPWEKAKEIGILGLTLKYDKSVEAKVVTAKLSSLPSEIKKPKIAKDLYNIIEIKVIDEATGKEIEPTGWIKFAVSKKWLKENGYSPDEVVMLRYHNGWTALETVKLGLEDENNIYYKAYTPGFSIFAVAVKAEEEKPAPAEEEKPVEEKPKEEEKKEEEIQKPVEEKPEEEKPTEEKPGISWTAMAIAIVVLIILGVGAYFYMGRKD